MFSSNKHKILFKKTLYVHISGESLFHFIITQVKYTYIQRYHRDNKMVHKVIYMTKYEKPLEKQILNIN